MSSHLANLEHFRALRLPDARAEYERQLNDATIESLSFIDRLDLILDKEITMRHNRRVARKLREATLRVVAYKEEFSFETHRGISRETFAHLTSLSFVDLDTTLTVVAGNAYRLCARKLPRYEQATPDRLWRHFLDNTGKITVAEDHVRVDLAARTYTPVLIDAGYPELDLPIPWWGGRTLRFGFPPR